MASSTSGRGSPSPEEVDAWDHWLEASVAQLGHKKLRRYLHPASVSAVSPVEVRLKGPDWEAWMKELGAAPASFSSPPSEHQLQWHSLRLFSSNDYLGLSMHPDVRRAASACAQDNGLGVRSSPLVAGFSHIHAELEGALARLKGTQDCLLFPTGFAANLSAMGALASDEAVDVFSDELNHASIIDGLRVSARGRTHVYRHNDIVQLEALLKEKRSFGRRQLVVTDSIFSMDGDFADVKALVALRRKYGFCLALDEAHATLVCGHSGGGAAEAAGVSGDEVDLHIGTLSKAAGAHGGFVGCSAQMKAWLLNRGRAYVYSTATPAPVAAAALAAIEVAQRESWRRRHLWDIVERFGKAVGVKAESPIIPIVLGSEAAALAASGQLLTQGFHVPAIRPPTVPAGTCRLRVALSAAHSFSDVDQLAQAVVKLGFDKQEGSESALVAAMTHKPQSRL